MVGGRQTRVGEVWIANSSCRTFYNGIGYEGSSSSTSERYTLCLSYKFVSSIEMFAIQCVSKSLLLRPLFTQNAAAFTEE